MPSCKHSEFDYNTESLHDLTEDILNPKVNMDRDNNALISTEMRNISAMTKYTGKTNLKMDER